MEEFTKSELTQIKEMCVTRSNHYPEENEVCMQVYAKASALIKWNEEAIDRLIADLDKEQ